MDYDVIIVGGGLGGLASGAILAKKGFKVHLLEQHDKVGGFASNFKRRRFNMEVAIHVLDGDHPYNLRNEIFDFLDIRDNVEFVRLSEFYTCHYEDNRVKVPDDMEAAHDHLATLFPHEKRGLDEYFKLMQEVNVKMHANVTRNPRVLPTSPLFEVLYPELNKLWYLSIGDYVDRVFNDELLKVVLLANGTFYHDNPREMNIMQYMSSQASYFLGGVYYVKGGSQVYSDHLAQIIRDHGGEVSLNHRVTQIRVEDGLAREVIYHKTRGSTKNDLKSARAKYIVVNAAMPVVYDHLIEDHPYKNQLNKFSQSTSATTLFYGLNKPLKEIGNEAHLNIFVEARKNMQDLRIFDHSVGVIDYDICNTGLCPEGVYSCDVIFMDKYSEWAQLSDTAYKERKKVVADFFTRKMEGFYPGFTDSVELVEVGTPKTITRYTSNPEGACYGFNPEFKSYYARTLFFNEEEGLQDRFVKNLFFGSAWSYLPGFSGAQIGGCRAAKRILKEEGLGGLYL